jgi:hypothetical protein
MIKDAAFEKEHGCTLSQVLERARKNGKYLFRGKIFTYTREPGVDPKILKNVIAANGGDSVRTLFGCQRPPNTMSHRDKRNYSLVELLLRVGILLSHPRRTSKSGNLYAKRNLYIPRT